MFFKNRSAHAIILSINIPTNLLPPGTEHRLPKSTCYLIHYCPVWIRFFLATFTGLKPTGIWYMDAGVLRKIIARTPRSLAILLTKSFAVVFNPSLKIDSKAKKHFKVDQKASRALGRNSILFRIVC